MGRMLKWVLIALVGLLLLAVAAVVIILAVFDPNDYRDEIAQEVQRRTGRELVIEGDIGLTFWPWLGLELGRTRLSDAPGFGDEPFVSLENARLGVAVWPLLSERKVVLDKIVLDGLNLRLIRNAQGLANWEQLQQQLAQGQEQKPQQPEAAPEEAAAGPVVVESLGGVEINNAQLLYEDRQAQQRYLLSPLNLQVRALELGAPMPVQGSWVLQSADAPEVAGKLSSEVIYQPESQQLSVRDLALELIARGEQIPGGELPLTLEGALQADLAKSVYEVPALAVQVAGVAAKATLQARQQGEAMSASGTLSVPGFSPRQLMQRLQIEPPQMADAQALTQLSAQAQFRYADGGVSIPELTLQLDESTLKGNATVSAFSPLVADFRLAIDRLNLDRYLPAPTQETAGQAPAPAPAPTGGEQQSELPLEMLRKLNLDGVLTIGQLLAKGMTVNDFKAELHAKNGQIRLDPMTAQLYQGQYKGAVQLDATGQQPRLVVDQRIDSVQAGPLLQDLMGDARVLGKGDLVLQADMTGAGVQQWREGMDGKASFKFSDGAVAGVNLAALIREAQARLTNQTAAADAETPTTDFSVLGGSLTINDGVVSNNDLSLMSPLMRVTGEGKVNLATRDIAYLLTVNLVKTLEGQGGKELAELSKVPIPIRITGNFTDLNFKVDLLEALKQSQGAKLKALEDEAKARLEAEKQAKEAELRQKIEEEKARLRQQAEEKAGKALQDLFRRNTE